jgi:hypothetical protein
VDSGRPLLIRLDAPGERGEQIVGGNAAKLMRAGFEVPQGFWLAGARLRAGPPLRIAGAVFSSGRCSRMARTSKMARRSNLYCR